MNEKKKLLVLLSVIIVIIILITSVLFVSMIQSSKKIKQIEEVIKSKETQIVYLSRPTCYYCNLIEPITDSLQEEFGLEYYHINTEDFSTSQMKKILEIMEVDESKFGTPYIAIVKDGKIIGEQIGYTDEDVLFKLFKENGLIEENSTLNMNYLDDLEEIMNSSESQLLAVGKSGDTASIESRINLRNLAKKYSVEINYFDTSKLETKTEYNELLNKLNVSAEQLPVLVVIKNGEAIEKTTQSNEKSLEEFLRENNYID